MNTLTRIALTIKVFRRGLLAGAAVGAIAAWYALSKGFDLTSLATEGKGLIDSWMGRSAPLDVAKYKVYGTFMFAGAAAGLLLEWLLIKFGLGGRRRR